jgi:hypothetical protein
MNRNRFTDKVAVAPLVMMTAVALSGCAGGPVDGESSARPAPVVPTTAPTERPSSAPTRGVAPASTGTPIVVEIDGQEIAGRLDDSPTAASLASRLPLTLTFDDHGGQEKYAELPEALDLTGAPQRSDAQPLQIGYYAPDQRLILYYAYVGTFSGIVPIGSYGSADAIQRQNEEFTVTIRQAD